MALNNYLFLIADQTDFRRSIQNKSNFIRQIRPICVQNIRGLLPESETEERFDINRVFADPPAITPIWCVGSSNGQFASVLIVSTAISGGIIKRIGRTLVPMPLVTNISTSFSRI